MNGNQLETKNYVKPKMPKKKKIQLAVSASAAALTVCVSAFLLFHPHAYRESKIIKASTCTEAGEALFKCFCGKTETRILGHTGHNEYILESNAPTCEENGLTEGRKCSVCGEITLSQSHINALGHSESVIEGISATCTKNGATEGIRCADCGKILSAPQTVYAQGHVTEKLSGKAASCTEEGLTDGEKCTVCNTVTVKQETIPMSHDVVIDKGYGATKIKDGLTDGKSCRLCGEILEKQEIIPAPLEESLGLAYTPISGSTCEITGIGTCTDSELIIPKYIDGYAVVSIKAGAFDDCENISDIIIHENIANIPGDAFFSCGSLKSVIIRNGASSIESWAFSNSVALREITISKSVMYLGSYAFASCYALESVKYEGTYTDWMSISKEQSWNYDTPEYTVYCTDAVIAKDGTVTFY